MDAPSPPHARQGREPSQPRLIPLEKPTRRLALDGLLSAVKSASLQVTRRAVQPISAACANELSAICADQVQLVQIVHPYSNGDVNSLLMLEALRTVHVCLATNSEALRPTCVTTLVREFLKQTPTLSEIDTNPVLPVSDPPTPTDHKADHHTNKDRHGTLRSPKDGHGESDSSNDSALTSGNLLYVISNNRGGGGSPPGGTTIDQWSKGEQSRDHASRHASTGDPSLIWLILLPFYCVGVFMIAKRAATLYRQRYGYPSPTGIKYEYVPLNDHDSP